MKFLSDPPRRLARRGPLAALAGACLLSACAASGGGMGAARPVSPDAFKAESGLGSYLAGRFAARANKDTTAAADFLSQALADDPENEVLIHRTMQLMLADGRIDQGRALAQRVVRFAPNDGLANLVLALDAVRGNDLTTAQRRMAEMPKSGFNQLIGPIVMAWIRHAEGQTDAALELLAGLKENNSFNAFRNFQTALILDVAGRSEAAAEAYRLANADTGGASLRVVEGYGNLLARLGRYDEARKLYADYLARNPDNPGITQLRDELGIGRVPTKPIAATPTDGIAEALYASTVLLARSDRSESGEIYVHLALHLKPDFVLARTLLGDLHENDNRWADAIKVYRGVDRSSPYSWATRLRIAWAMTRIERKDEAIALLRDMSREQPSRSDALVSLGDILRGEERFAESAEEYSRAIERLDKIEGRHWQIFYARGIAYERSKQWPKAEADFLKALELKPDDPLVLNYLGYSWVDQGQNLDKALGMIERAVRQRPNDGYIVDSLGWAFYRLGRFEPAVLQLERAVELRPEDPTINDHLGDAYWMTGRRAEARFQWRRALSLKPEAAQVPAIEEKLARGLPPPARPTAAKTDRK